MPELIFSGIIVVVVLIVLSIFFTFFPLGLWISAIAAGVKVSIFTLVGRSEEHTSELQSQR